MAESKVLRRIAIIGFGEAGSILGTELARQGASVSTFDILLDAAATRDACLERARAANVRPANTLAAALENSELVISAVTATNAATVARQAAACLHAGQIYLDINSVAPETKRACAAAVQPSGAEYVEAAVMAAVPPKRLAVPMLLGGRAVARVAPLLGSLGMNVTAISEEIGVASAIKLCRSIMIKGIEALTVECLFAARHFHAEQQVLESLERTFPSMGWSADLPDYLVSRVAGHGQRRAAEMREVVAMLRAADLPSAMASATAEVQDRLGVAARKLKQEPFSWRRLADDLAP